MKVKELTFKIAAPKPRDPNQVVLASKKNAGGPMRDKRREQRNGDSKHKGRAFEDLQILEDSKITPHKYSVKLTFKGKDTHWPALKGEIYEKDVVIGRFSRGAVRDGYVPPIEYKFLSAASKNRFDDFADSLSIAETIEALLP